MADSRVVGDVFSEIFLATGTVAAVNDAAADLAIQPVGGKNDRRHVDFSRHSIRRDDDVGQRWKLGDLDMHVTSFWKVCRLPRSFRGEPR